MICLRSIPVKRFAAVIVLALALAMLWNPTAARAAAGAINTSAQGARVNIGLLGLVGFPSITLGLPAQQNWTTGGSTATKTDLGVDLLPAPLPSIIKVGAITATAQPATGGGRAQADVAGLNLLGVNSPAVLNLGAIRTQCQMTSTGITGTTDIADLKVLGLSVNPDVNLDLGNLLGGIASGWIDHRTAAWDSTTGRLDYTIRAVDLKLLKGTGLLTMIANGDVVIAESVCSGIVKLGSVTTSPVNLVPGNSATPSVSVQNTGDIAAPNTTITIPAPPTGYTVGTPSITGSNGTGSCAVASSGTVTCTNVTVPGAGTVKVNVPVTLSATATNAADWSPAARTITANSTPVSGSSTVIPASGSGTLVAAQPAASTGGSFAVPTPSTLTAGKTATTSITVSNQGPSNATTTVTIPIDNAPAGVSVTSAKVGSTPCSVTTSAITCSGVSVAAGSAATIDVATKATLAAVPGTVWNLQGMTANLNGTPIGGQAKFLTVGDPDVNLTGGVSITPANGTPGGGTATATVRVVNTGGTTADPATITIPAPPAGYTVGSVTTSNGIGTCAQQANGSIQCTGVRIPSGSANAVTISIPVTLAANVTANWSAAAGTEVRATTTDSTGTATGAIINAVPRSTLGITATGPADGTVNPGQNTSMAVNVYNQGPSDARNSAFVVVAPPNTTFGTLTAPTSNLCTNLTSTTLRCTISMGAGDPATGLTLPLVVSAAADPATPITGGCVSLDNDSACDGPTDQALPTVKLRTPLATRLTTSTDAATITPGTSGTGKLTLTSTQAETGVTVTIPTTGLPVGFTVGQATVAGGTGTCTTGSGAITCTGITLTAGQAKDISVPITVASSVTPPQAWSPSGIVIATGNEQVSRSGSLAGTGTGNYTLTAPTLTVPTDGSVEPGGTTSMQVAVRNIGPSDATNASFSVRAPAGTTFGALSAPATPMCTLTSSTVVTCTTTLTAGSSTSTLTLPLQVGANTDPDKTVTGGCVDLDGTPGCGSSDTAIPSFTLKVPFSMQATVTADRADVTPGSTATATVHVAAPHNDLSGVTVTIPLTALPAGLTVTGQTPGGCTRTASAVTCPGLSITKGNTADIGLTVNATSSSTAGTGWTATGITVASGSDSITSAQELARVGAAQPALSAAITLPAGTLLPGATGNLDVAVTNTGPSDAKSAPVVVTAPLGATFSPLNGATATACTLSPDSRTATCSVDLAAGAPAAGLSFPLRVDATAAPGSTLTGGCVDLDGQPGCSPTTDKPIASITVGTPLQRRLTVTTNPATLVPGQTNRTAELTIKSTATESGLTVTIPTINLPAGVTASSATVPGGTCTVNASAIVCSPVNLPTAGQTVTVALNTSALPSTAAATWTAAGITVAKGSDTATASGDLAVIGQPQTTVTADASVPPNGAVTAGSNADITVKVSNGGPSNASPATFTVRAPDGTTFAALPPNTASICTVGPATVATCSVNLAAGADTGNLIFPVAVPVTADPFVTLGGGCVDLDGAAACTAGDKVIPAITLKVPFDRRAAITATPATVTPGGSGSVKVRATSLKSGDNLSNLTLTVPLAALPPSLIVGTPAPGACAKSGSTPDTVVCSNVSITGGGYFDLTLPVSAPASAAAGVTWTATGITLASGSESVTATRALATTGAATFALNPTVTMPSGSIEPGATTAISVSVNNPGPSDATGAKLAYNAPAGTTFGTPTGSLAVGCTVDSPTRITCNNVNLANGATGTLTLPITVDASADPTKPISGGCVDGNADGYCTSDPADTAFTSFALTVPFSQRVSVTTTSTPVSPGTTGTASVVVTNSGNTNLTGLTVTVPLPPVGSDVTLTPTAGCSIVGSTITCTNVSVTAGGNTTIPIDVAMAGGAPATTAYASTVSVSDGTPGNTVTARRVVASAGSAAYTLAAQLTGPADNTVLPGTTTSITAVISNTGSNAAVTAPVTITAPTGTTFGTLAPSVSTACTLVNPTTLSCGVDVSGTAVPPALPVTWTLPISVPAGTTAATLTGGCVDLNDNGACATAEQLPTIVMRKALSAVLVPSGTPPTITPGNSGSSVITLAASETRTGLVVGLDPAGLPTGVSVTGARINTTDCQVTTNAVSCPATTINAGATAELTVDVATGPSSPASSGAGWSQALTVTQAAETLTLHPTIAKIGAAVSSLTVALVVPDAGTLKPGTTGEMDVTLTNPGPSANPTARAVFTAPTGTTFAALSGPAAALCTVDSPTQVSCGTSLGVESKSFTLGISVPANASTSSPLTGGCVDIVSDGVCPGPGDRTIPAITLAKPFSAQAGLGISPLTIVPGTSDTATLTVAPDRPLSGMTATVPLSGLPQGLTVMSVTGPSGSTCTWVGAITCTGVNATTSTTNLITITVRAAASMASGTVWSPNPVTLTSAAGDTAQVTGTLVRTGTAATNLSFDMSAPTTPVAPGSTATITATAANSGPSDATGLVARLIAPTGTTFGPLTGRAATDCTPVGNTQLDCRTNLPVGAAAAQWALPVRIPANANPNATISGGCIDLNRDGACAAAPADYPLPSIAVQATLDQAVTATATSPAIVPGRNGTVAVTLTTTRAASAVTVTIPTTGLPSGVTIAQAQSTSGTCSAVVNGAITCTGVNVPVGSGGTTITLGADVATAATPGQPAWTPTLTLVEAGVTAAKAISSTLVGAADAKPVVTFTVPAAQSLKPGDTGAIDVTVTNQGTSTAKNVHYLFRAPTGTTFQPPTGTTASLCTRNPAGTVVDCRVTVDGSAKVQFPLPLQVSPTADPASPVSGGCADVNLDNNCGGTNDVTIPAIQLGQPAGQLVISGTPGTVTPGSTATGQVKVTSAGAITGATVVVPLSTLPAGFTVTGATGPGNAFCSVSTTEIRCTGVALSTGTTTAVTVTTKVAATVAPGVAWRATGVTVTSGSDSATGAADIATSGARVAAVTFKATPASTTVKPGDSTSVSVVATNAGPSNAVRRTVTMTAPTGTTFGTLTGTAAQDCVISGSTVTCTYDLDANQSKTYTVPLVVSSSAKNGDTIAGACVTADGAKVCGADVKVSVDNTSTNPSISKTGTLSLTSAVVAAGASGTAEVKFSSTVAHTGLTLTVPLTALPDGFSVTSATVEGATCTVGATAISCTGVDLAANVARTLSIGVGVASNAAATASWTATGITLADPKDADDKLTASGLIVSTSRRSYSVGVTYGSPSNTSPLPGQTTTLPITFTNAGPDDASPYTTTIQLPANTTAGTLPDGCVLGETGRTIVCTVSLPAGTSRLIQVPIVIGSDLKGGESITGGCIDGVLGDDPQPDGECGGDADVSIPEVTLGRYKVNLAVTYNEPAVTVGPNATGVVVRIPYTNEGTDTADNVRFTVVPPTGVVVRSASVVLDNTTVSEGVVVAAATDAKTVAATCEGVGGAAASNAVVCTAPDAAGLYGSQLLLTIDGSKATKSGTQPMKVTISTTSTEGNSQDNTVSVMLKLTAKASSGGGSDNDGDDNGGGKLPTTGAQIAGTALVSLLMIVAGATLMLAMRERRLPTPASVRIPVRVPPYSPRHSRPRWSPTSLLRRE
ncbi:hypothetical protein JIG36_31115 [Actinoplanes sp. LDG1-06]|uniref:DUF11 domain-containing protein n=1 Tax=Paractinoplanes ovalisporus TaxID=2810368 RepID=A0ABS2AKS8_9ACTN|nr:DUF11 domain-containing protein [Actinoplanes ovalisporus]MBM2619973.1 hypothetical protein [Actinoplanes ovalisporus]